jgi:AcrR family transcriptional regulator
MTTTARGRATETRQRILDAALEVFAEKGFAQASTREIAKRAQANIASLHYHFGDKADLYRAVFTQSSMRTTAEVLGVAPEEAPFEAILRHLIRQFLNGLAEGHFPRLFAREQIDPSGLLGDSWIKEIHLTHDLVVGSLVRELRIAAPDKEVHRLAFALMGLPLILDHGRPLVNLIAPELLTEPNWVEVTLERQMDYARALLAAERARREANATSFAPAPAAS